MKRISIFVIILFTLFNSLFSQTFYNNGDTLYVWASSGLNLREFSETTSKIIDNIPYGERVIILRNNSIKNSNLKIKVSCFIDNKPTPEFNLKGKMTLIRYKDFEGFVFDAFLSRILPIPQEYYIFTFNDFLKKNFGISETVSSNKNGNSTEQIVYNNGVVYNNKIVSTCFQTTYTIPDITFQEGFLIVYHLFNLYKKELNKNDCQWYVSELGDNYVKFWIYDELLYKVSIRLVDNSVVITI